MLKQLSIKNFVLVEHTELDFHSGFTVFTGETGAGKSILIDALSITLGERAEAGMVRQGTDRADVTAVFAANPQVQAWLTEHELQAGESDGELLLRRTVDAQGRSRAFINGTPSTAAQLKAVGEMLIDIHGQHAHQSLLRADAQRELLDAHAQTTVQLAAVRNAWNNLRQAQQTLEQATTNAKAAQDEHERLAWTAQEIERVAPKPDEWTALAADHKLLANAQALIDTTTQAVQWLSDQQGNALQLITQAQQRLNNVATHDPRLQGVLSALETAHINLDEAVHDLNAYLGRADLDPRRLEQVEQRIDLWHSTARRLRIPPEELLAAYERTTARLKTLDRASDINALQAAVTQAQAAYDAAAKTLSTARGKAAKTLAKQVTTSMQTLAMQGGSFEVSVTAGTPGPYGHDAIELKVAPHPGASPKPLGKVASGGELSRISLALSVIASSAKRVPTLIFDEVDTGVGGAVAQVIGSLLRELGAKHQVLCVTHLPQVAARGHHHLNITKESGRNSTRSNVVTLSEEQRVQEVARMLAGTDITDSALAHAKALLQPQ